MDGFIVGEFAAIPYGKRYIIIYKGSQMEKICRTEKTARAYIDELKKTLVPPKKPTQAPRQRKKKII